MLDYYWFLFIGKSFIRYLDTLTNSFHVTESRIHINENLVIKAILALLPMYPSVVFFDPRHTHYSKFKVDLIIVCMYVGNENFQWKSQASS